MVAALVETRKVFAGEGTVARAIFYLLSLVSIVAFCWGVWLRWRKYREGRSTGWRWRRPATPADVPDVTARPALSRGLAAVATNETIGRNKRHVGGSHLLVFWGFLGLFAATVILSLDYDILGNLSRLFVGHTVSFFHGPFYLGYNAVFNTAGVALLVGLAGLAFRRARRREPQLDYARAHQPEGGYSRRPMERGDWLFLSFLGWLGVTGFLVQGLRIDEARFPSFERWTWMGYLVARGWQAIGVTPGVAPHVHPWVWWLHVLAALAFVAYIPYSKAVHMLTSPAKLLVRDPATTRRLPGPPADKPAYTTMADFAPTELLGFDACTKCGRCHAVCPARTAGAPLSPRDLILDLRQWVDANRHIPAVLDRETRPQPTGPLSPAEGVPLAGGVVGARTLWSCTTCMACVEICPVGIEHVPTIVQLRRGLVDAGDLDPTLQAAFQNLAQQGNSFGKSSRMRARWTKGLDFTIPDARKEPVDLLWFVGDYASFDERLQGLSRSLAVLLERAGVRFGLLYEDERNAGNDVRRAGEEGLFELLVEHNMAAFAKASFTEILTTDPHSFNTLRNEYPAFGLDAPVRHYSEVLCDLVLSGRLPVRPLDRTVTYHDPCYLGRYNRVFDAPRALLGGLGCTVVEMPRNRESSFCCGAGGGRIWMDDSYLAERPSENRIREAVDLGVDTFVVACPKDFAMFSDAVKTTGMEQVITVVDIVELTEAAFDPAAVADAAGMAPA